jgi:hypothetical protein
MKRVNLSQSLIGLVLRQHPDFGRRLVKRLYRELSQKAMPQFEARVMLAHCETAPSYDQFRVELKRAILLDLANLMPASQRPDLTHLFVNYTGSLSMKRFVLATYRGESK